MFSPVPSCIQNTIFILLVVFSILVYADERRGRGIWFTLEPEDRISVVGGSTVLDCQAKSSDNSQQPKITWTTSDTATTLTSIEDPRRSLLRNGSLLVRSVVGSEEGDHGAEHYHCLASVPSIGTIISRTATITIARLPPLEDQPKSLRVYPGQTAHFACFSPGKPSPSVTWLKDQRPLIFDETRMLLLPSGSLEIDDIQTSDAGVYRCNVTGLDRHRTSEKAYLSVNQDLEMMSVPMAPVFIAQPRSTVTMEGSTVTLDCAANGIPKPFITWLKDGVPIDMADLDSRFRMIGTGSLQISQVVESDSGNYQCRAGNKEDSQDALASLHVQVSPRFIRKPQSIVAMAKTDIELECEVYAKPEPTVTWYKNGEIIPPNNYLQVVNGNNLRILGLLEEDYGIFQCVASNPAGNVQSAALLTVTTPEAMNSSGRRFSMHGMRPVDSGVPVDHRGRSIDKNRSVVSGGETNAAGPPMDLEAAIVKPRFVTLRWKPPYPHSDPILSYRVFYKQESSDRERVVNTSRSRLEETNIAGLLPNTTYVFRVAAMTARGLGSPSPPLRVVTVPELHVPSSPTVVSAMASTSEILVQWLPPHITNGDIVKYRLYYFESETSEEHHVETVDLNYSLTGLKRYTEYIVWVVAYNHNGAGSSSQEITLRTLSDVPSEPPTNVTVEVDSSTSVTVRWEPPPVEGRNGIITGYKLRYRKKSAGRGAAETVTTAGNKRFYSITGLEKSSSYQVRVWAMTVNGTGPPTDWYTIETYENDLDESSVPDEPNGMRVRPNANSITVMWAPPRNPNIMVRDYIIGWGKGVPDEYVDRLDSKQRIFIIKDLEANSEYVISLRAHNERGNGPPIYETVRTSEEGALNGPLEAPPLTPPVGLKATVLSANTVVLFWTDTTLPLTQIVTDNRFYVVRYSQYHPTSPLHKYKYYNSTVLNFMLDDLKPHTQYEFAVKLVKGRRESSWSMMVVNTTFEALPGSPARDVIAAPHDSLPGSVTLVWQPPKIPNGEIIGYIISYSKDKSSKEWSSETVGGDVTNTVIKSLSPSSTYYFYVQAKNSKGLSPASPIISVITPHPLPGASFDFGQGRGDGDGGLSGLSLIYVIIGCSALAGVCITATIVIVCCRNKEQSSPDSTGKSYMKGKASSSSLKPPDLWIHHDQMELKNLQDKREDRETSTGSLPRDRSASLEKHHHSSNYGSSGNYMGSPQCQPLLSNEEKTSTARRSVKPKPITLPVDNSHFREPVATATPVGGVSSSMSSASTGSGLGSDSRPLYPRTQYSISRAHVTIDPSGENPYVVGHSTVASVTYEPLPSSVGNSTVGPPPPAQSTPAQPTYSTTGASSGGAASGTSCSGSDGKPRMQQGHPLKSFSVPAPPPQSAPTTPQQKHIVTVRAQQGSSPYKKSPSAGQYSTVNVSPKSRHATPPASTSQEQDLPKIQPSYSTEELNQEMANLEGLMKDLNAITASEFEC